MFLNLNFLTVSSLVLVVFIIAGTVVLAVMKKMKKSENQRAILTVAVTLAGVILAGFLVYGVTMAMMMNLAVQKEYYQYTFENPEKTHNIIINEYGSMRETGFEIYLDEEKKLVGDIKTEGQTPFTSKKYELEWNGDELKIYYQFNADGQIKCCEISLSESKLLSDTETSKKLSS